MSKELFEELDLTIAEIRKENQKLKEKLYLCTPEIPQNSHNNYISYVDLINKLYSIEKENQELKKQLEKYEDPEDLTLIFMYCNEKAKDKIKELERVCHLDAKETLATINYEHESQQKEFIKYLEDEWARHEYISAHEVFDENKRLTEQKIRSNIFEILQKYKEIIQTKNNNSV